MVRAAKRVRHRDEGRTVMDFFIYSRYAIEAVQAHEVSHIIVSITTPGDPKPNANIRTNEHTLGVLRLTFHDLDRVVPGFEADAPKMFQPEQAKAILELVKAYPEAQRFVVHCDAGMSRSPAVAAALSKILTGDDSYFFTRYHPNMLVYRRILEAHHGV